jgi:hypothetical protein
MEVQNEPYYIQASCKLCRKRKLIDTQKHALWFIVKYQIDEMARTFGHHASVVSEQNHRIFVAIRKRTDRPKQLRPSVVHFEQYFGKRKVGTGTYGNLFYMSTSMYGSIKKEISAELAVSKILKNFSSLLTSLGGSKGQQQLVHKYIDSE